MKVGRYAPDTVFASGIFFKLNSRLEEWGWDVDELSKENDDKIGEDTHGCCRLSQRQGEEFSRIRNYGGCAWARSLFGHILNIEIQTPCKTLRSSPVATDLPVNTSRISSYNAFEVWLATSPAPRRSATMVEFLQFYAVCHWFPPLSFQSPVPLRLRGTGRLPTMFLCRVHYSVAVGLEQRASRRCNDYFPLSPVCNRVAFLSLSNLTFR
jgi:hypothetical protein